MLVVILPMLLPKSGLIFFLSLLSLPYFLLFIFLARANYPAEFSEGPLHLHTLVLISSSYFLVKRIFSLRNDRPK